MQRIASPQDLQAELRRILAYCQSSENPSREKLTVVLRELAVRVAGEFTEKEWESYKREHPGADPKDHKITKGDKGRDVSKEKGFEALKGLDPAKQRDIIQKALLNMEAEKDADKDGPTKQRDVSKEEGFKALKGLSPAAQRKVIERALKTKKAEDITSPQELQSKIRDLITSTQGPERPSRERIAAELRELASATAKDDDKDDEDDDVKKPFPGAAPPFKKKDAGTLLVAVRDFEASLS